MTKHRSNPFAVLQLGEAGVPWPGTAGPQPLSGIFVPSPNVAAKALVKPGRGAGSEQEAARELQEVALQLLGKGKRRVGKKRNCGFSNRSWVRLAGLTQNIRYFG